MITAVQRKITAGDTLGRCNHFAVPTAFQHVDARPAIQSSFAMETLSSHPRKRIAALHNK
ncbi:hypothetical protein USDA257_p02130 (plasmid) [Sinorhizobium fredii USDA 257]|uniref:Uncharacterized protein n=1 Tax=Sinorhizobium fredii (strain USDA 257) TaxID=1185652 RepID=I3XGC2_SINF2|nr:hypothetical protein USDA257_p02130 [Sinorhizobium fredii USDA 257]CCE99207.1 hypothetical protein SFHH103_04734 [Sinorhizobium fredii HH103]